MKILAIELIEDFGLYPRSTVDGAHVARLADVLEAGAKFPPILIDEQNRIIDGFHRRRAFLRVFGDQVKVECKKQSYKDDKGAFLDALRLNAKHGKSITGSEQTGAIIKARNFKIEVDKIAFALGITQERVESISQTKITHIRTVRVGAEKKEIPLKRSVYHLSRDDRGVTEKQAEVIKSAPGQAQSLLLRQVNQLIEADLIDWKSEQVVSEMKRLAGNMEMAIKKVS